MSTNQRLRQDAQSVFEMSLKRAGVRCPAWARTQSMRAKFLRIYKEAQWQKRFRRKTYHVDHIIPLHSENVSGLHVPWNLHAIPAVINMAKGTMRVADYETPYVYKPNRKERFMEWFAGSLQED